MPLERRRPALVLPSLAGLGLAVAGLLACDEAAVVRAAPAQILANTDRLDFGDVVVGDRASRRLTLLNPGGERLEISAIAVEGSPVFTAPTGAMAIPAGERIELELGFAPTALGPVEATLAVASSAPTAPRLTLVLAGRGTDGDRCGDCSQPPPAVCVNASVLVSYETPGSCVGGACVYARPQTTGPSGCDTAARRWVGAAVDAGVTDAGPAADATPVDASAADASAADAGARDAEPADLGPPDTGEVDAGLERERIFDRPGVESFVVPPGVTEVQAELWGGGGAGGNQAGATGGGAGAVAASFTVTPGETLEVWVAEGGRQPGNGGGASYLRRGGDSLAVAGGGGGGGSDGNSGNSAVGGAGGAGGGMSGEDGRGIVVGIPPFCTAATGGQGAGTSDGGEGGRPSGNAANRCDGQPGAAHAGGAAKGVNGRCDTDGAREWRQGGGQGNGGGGGGGSGWFGGGGAGFIWTYCGGGGGGGSSYVDLGAGRVRLTGGAGQTQGEATGSSGAGRGGDRGADGADGRVVLRW